RHVGPQREQRGARRAQPVRHGRRLHGQLVVRQSVAHVHGADGAGRGLRGERAQAPQPVSTPAAPRAAQVRVAATSFLALFAIVGIALYGLPFFYDFMVREFGWSRAQVTSGNAISKLLVGPLFGFLAGWLVDRFGPRRLMVAGILMAGIALVGLGAIHSLTGFYFFYLFNALGNFCGGPLPNQVLLSRWFTAARGRAMGFAYLGIGIGGAIVPFLALWLTQEGGWRGALQSLGLLIGLAALPRALVPTESRGGPGARGRAVGFAALGTGIGGAIVPFLALWLTQEVGWRGALQSLGLLIVLAALPLTLVVKESPDGAAARTPSPEPLAPGPASVA